MTVIITMNFKENAPSCSLFCIIQYTVYVWSIGNWLSCNWNKNSFCCCTSVSFLENIYYGDTSAMYWSCHLLPGTEYIMTLVTKKHSRQHVTFSRSLNHWKKTMMVASFQSGICSLLIKPFWQTFIRWSIYLFYSRNVCFCPSPTKLPWNMFFLRYPVQKQSTSSNQHIL